MRLPLSVRLLGTLRRFTGSTALLDPSEVPARRDRAGRIQAGPPGRYIVGRRPRDVVIEETGVAIDDDGTPVVIPVRVYRPPRAVATPAPVVVNFHGGGFVQGDLDQSDWLCGTVCRDAGVVVISVDYRLAPEHPFPGPANDCYGVVAALAADPGTWAVDADALYVMGDSAGGTLATVCCLMARDRRRAGESAPRIAGQLLIYPGTETVDVLPSERSIPVAPILSAADIRGFARLYLAGADGTHPYASPLRADLTDLPPALVLTAEHDPLRDHGEFYVRALAEAGVPVRHTRFVGAAHGFVSTVGLHPSVAHQAVWEITTALRLP